MYEEKKFRHPVKLAWFSIHILVNSKIFKLPLNLSITHLRAQIVCYELNGDLSPVMFKEIFHESFENFEITTRICIENHASVTGWQKLFFSYKCFQLSAADSIISLTRWHINSFTHVPLWVVTHTGYMRSKISSVNLSPVSNCIQPHSSQVILSMVAQRYYSKICTILRRKNKK